MVRPHTKRFALLPAIREILSSGEGQGEKVDALLRLLPSAERIADDLEHRASVEESRAVYVERQRSSAG